MTDSLRRALEPYLAPGAALCAQPKTRREVIDVLHIVKDAHARLGQDVVLDRSLLQQIGRVDDASMSVEVEAGVPLRRVEAVLQARTLTLGALTPAAWEMNVGAFLEGPLAGARAIPGGRLEPVCASLVGVFADGRVLESSAAPRSATGPDLTSLFLGAEGRLGLVVAARLRAFAAPMKTVHARWGFSSALVACGFLRDALARGAWPTSVSLSVDEPNVLVDVRWSGSVGAVERDRQVLHRAAELARATALAAPAALPELMGAETERSWADVERALETSPRLDLHRLSLSTAVVLGARTPATSIWPLEPNVLHALDPAAVLGGAP